MDFVHPQYDAGDGLFAFRLAPVYNFWRIWNLNVRKKYSWRTWNPHFLLAKHLLRPKCLLLENMGPTVSPKMFTPGEHGTATQKTAQL